MNPEMEISVEEVRDMRAANKLFMLLDCRRYEELDLASLGDVTHIPMDELDDRIGELNPEEDIVVLCHHGRRSLTVTQFLQLRNFSNVKSMHGGIEAWSFRIDSSVPLYE